MSRRAVGERVRDRRDGTAGRIQGVNEGPYLSYDVVHEDGTRACYAPDELEDGGVGRSGIGSKDEEIELLRGLLAEAVRRSVGTHGAVVTTVEDLGRKRPPFVLERREDGAWRMRFDVRALTTRDVT